MRWALGAPIGIERPLDAILGEAVTEHGAGMIEDDRVGLAIGRAQHAADHLAIEPHLLGRPRQDAAADLGHVPAFGQHHAIGDDLDLAGRQARQRRIALGLRRGAVDVLGAHAGLDELVAEMDRVRDVDREADGLSALAVFVPVRDDVADQLRPIHALGELAFDVIAGDACARP